MNSMRGIIYRDSYTERDCEKRTKKERVVCDFRKYSNNKQKV